MAKSPDSSTRIQKLLDQIDFLTQEHLKLAAKLKSQEENIISFTAILHPTLLMAQTLILDWVSLGDNLEPNISASLNAKMKVYFEHPIQIFLNYIGIVKLKIDIVKNPDTKKRQQQLAQFSEKLNHLKEDKTQLKKMVGEEYYFQYDLAIDEVFFPYQKRFQEFVKVIDAFQLKITNLHSLIPSELETAWDASSEKIQTIEEEIETIRKKLHNLGETLIYRLIEGFIQILGHILEKAEGTNLVDLNLEEYIQDQYKELQDIRDQFLCEIDNDVLSSLDELLSPLHSESTEFIQYYQPIFDQFHKIHPTIDSQLELDLKSIDARIQQLSQKIMDLKKSR